MTSREKGIPAGVGYAGRGYPPAWGSERRCLGLPPAATCRKNRNRGPVVYFLDIYVTHATRVNHTSSVNRG